MPAVQPNTTLNLPTRQRWSRVASIFGALFVATLLLSALFSGVQAAPRVNEATTPAESTGAGSARMQLEPPQQPSVVWTICSSGCDFGLIQDAINDPTVADGDTLLVMDAVHIENWIIVDKDVVIRGQGAQDTIVQASSAPPEFPSGGGQLFRISSGTTATISDMTIRYGFMYAEYVSIAVATSENDDGDAVAVAWVQNNIVLEGAGISVEGDLTLENAVVSDNLIVITSTAHAVATATAPITATAGAYALASNQMWAAGAGIHNSGNLTVSRSTIANNEIYVQDMAGAQVEANAGVITETAVVTSAATIAGAGIYNEGSLWLSNSTVSDNRAHTSNTAHAANEVNFPTADVRAIPESIGAQNEPATYVTGTESAYIVVESDKDGHRIWKQSDAENYVRQLPGWVGADEFTPNLTQDLIRVTAFIEARAVAGVYNDITGTASIHFSTISDNLAVTEADASGDVTMVSRSEVGSLFNETGAVLNLNSTIIASQAHGADCAQTDNSSDGYNLDSDGTCALSGPGDESNADARLAPLGGYGGPTPTHALLFGSPALDAGDPDCPTSVSTRDQRGVSRPVEGDGVGDAACDIGAVEEVFEADLRLEEKVVGQKQIDGQPGNTFTEIADMVTAGARVTYTFSVHNDGPEGAPTVLLQHTIPEELEATGATITSSQGSCDSELPADRSVPLRCELGTQLPGELVTVTVAAATAPSISDGAVLQSEASISSAALDDDASNDSVLLISDVNRRADVMVSKVQTPEVAHPGEVLTYVISIENRGPSDAPPVIVTDIFADGLQDGSWVCTAENGAACGNASGSGSVLQLVELPAAAVVTYTITAQVSSCSTLENRASASNTLDPYPEDNSDTAINRAYCVFLLPLLSNQTTTVEN